MLEPLRFWDLVNAILSTFRSGLALLLGHRETLKTLTRPLIEEKISEPKHALLFFFFVKMTNFKGSFFCAAIIRKQINWVARLVTPLS